MAANGIATPNASTPSASGAAADLAKEYEFGETDALPGAAAGNLETPGGGNAASRDAKDAAGEGGTKPVDTSAGNPSAPKHSSRLLRLAQSVGLDEQTILTTPTDELRELVMERQQTQQSDRRQEIIEQGQRALPARNPSNGQFQKPDGTPDVDAIKAAADGRVEDIGFKLDFGKGADGTTFEESDIHPALVNVLKQLGNAVAKLEQGHNVLASAEMARRNESVTQTIDRVFASLGAEYEPHIGRGGRGDVSPDSLEFAHRLLIVQRAQRNQTAGTFEQKLVQAAKELFGGRVAPAAGGGSTTPGNGVVERVAEWNQAGLSLPSNRTDAAEAPGYDRAVQTADRKMREAGYETVGDAGGTTANDFL